MCFLLLGASFLVVLEILSISYASSTRLVCFFALYFFFFTRCSVPPEIAIVGASRCECIYCSSYEWGTTLAEGGILSRGYPPTSPHRSHWMSGPRRELSSLKQLISKAVPRTTPSPAPESGFEQFRNSSIPLPTIVSGPPTQTTAQSQTWSITTVCQSGTAQLHLSVFSSPARTHHPAVTHLRREGEVVTS